MNGETVSSILIIVVLVLLSAYFSATETAFSSLNRTRLRTLAEKGNHRAETTLRLAEEYDKLLSSILVGNNVVNIAMASIATLLFVRLLPRAGATVSTIVITIVVLIFGEVSPKSLAKERPEQFAMWATPLMRVLIWILTPINFLFTQWKKLLSRLFRIQGSQKMSQEELLMLVEEVAQEGTIDASEEDLLRSAIEFTDRDAEDILTHRVDLEAIALDATPEEIARVFTESRFSRLLVYDESIDNIVGVLHQKDFYTGTGVSRRPISELMKQPVFAPQSVKISTLLKLLQKHQSQVAVISDEYGGTLGIITMEDILEEQVGDIWDEHDEVIEDFRPLDEHTCRVRGAAPLAEFERYFEVDCASDCASVSGWVMERLGKIPALDDAFDFPPLTVAVTETDSRRVVEITVTVHPRTDDNQDDKEE